MPNSDCNLNLKTTDFFYNHPTNQWQYVPKKLYLDKIYPFLMNMYMKTMLYPQSLLSFASSMSMQGPRMQICLLIKCEGGRHACGLMNDGRAIEIPPWLQGARNLSPNAVSSTHLWGEQPALRTRRAHTPSQDLEKHFERCVTVAEAKLSTVISQVCVSASNLGGRREG